MLLQKEHLTGDYDWTGGVDPSVFTDGPTRRKFDRHNGNQVLFLINLYISFSGKQTLSEGLKMETLLNTHLPFGVKSEISVFKWLNENFNTLQSADPQV
jgi:hypothetical protein